MNRRFVAGVSVVSLLPAVTAALVVRPAIGQERAYGLYAVTIEGGATFIEGEVGAGGGLAVLDGGAPYAAGRLDSSPSADVRAAAVEPGTLFRTVAGVANDEANDQVLDVPLAEAQFPGNPEGRIEGSGEQDAGGFRASGASAFVTAAATMITAEANGNSEVILPAASAARLTAALAPLRLAFPNLTSAAPSRADGTIVTEGGQVRGSATTDPAGALTATFVSTVSSSTVMGEIGFSGVEGTATATTLPDGTREADASIVVGRMTVAGMPVFFGSDGLEVAGTPLLPGQDLQDATAMVTEALSVSGVTIEPLTPVETTEDGSARADSRGVRVTIVNGGSPDDGIPGDTVTYILGGASVTIADEPPFAAPPPLPVTDTGPPPTPAATPTSAATTPPPVTSPPPPPVSAGTSSGGFSSGSNNVSSGPAVSVQSTPAPVVATDVAPTTTTLTAPVLVAGRRVDKRLAIAAFGAWQLISLSICTGAVFALKRRRLTS